MLLGHPVTLDDCLDRARARVPVTVEVLPRLRTLIGEHRVVSQFVADCTWSFPDRRVVRHEVCGAVAAGVAAGEADRRLRRADARLERMVERIRAAGAHMHVGGEGFASCRASAVTVPVGC